MNPQQASRGLPTLEGVALTEPRCGILVVSTRSSVVIDGRIGGREPISELMSEPIDCSIGELRAMTSGNYGRLISSTVFTIRSITALLSFSPVQTEV